MHRRPEKRKYPKSDGIKEDAFEFLEKDKKEEQQQEKVLQKSYRIKQSEFLNLKSFITKYSMSESQAVRFAIKFFVDNYNNTQGNQ